MADSTSENEARWIEAAELIDEGMAGLERGQIDEAAAAVDRGASILEEVVGRDHPDYGQALAAQGSVAWVRGEPALAEARFRAALEIYELYRADPEDASVVRPLLIQALRSLGMVLNLKGDWAEAEQVLKEALREASAETEIAASAVASLHQALGVCFRFAGRYNEALQEYQRVAETLNAAGIPLPADHYHNLAGLACALEEFAEAEAHARRAIESRRREIAEQGGERAGLLAYLGTDLCGLGDALAGQERNEEALQAYTEGIESYHAANCSDHVEVAYAAHNLADTLAAAGRNADAEAAYRDSLSRKIRAFGEEHHEVAATLNNLAALLADIERLDEARSLSAKAVAIARTTLPANHPIRAGCEALAQSLEAAS